MRASSLPKFLLLLVFSLWLTVSAHSQDSSSLFNRILSFPDKVFGRIDKEANKYEQKLTQQTEKYLNKLERQEQKLKRKLWRTDSTKAKEVFGDVKGRYDGLRNTLKAQEDKVQGNTSTVYNGHLDSLGTAMNFLQNNPQLQQATAIKDKLSTNVKSIADLKSKLNQTENIRKQIQQRQQELKRHLQNTPLAKEFRKFKKEVYYYQAQVKEYHDALKDPKKLGAKMLQVANKVPAFQDFFSRNSELAGIFQLPGQGGNAANSTVSTSFPTRQMVQNTLMNNLGLEQNPSQLIQQGVDNGNSYLSNLKNKIKSKLPANSGESDMPDFKPNSQKTKGFLKRIEIGTTAQTVKSNFYFPTTSDLGITVGYKLNDKSIVGVGMTGKVGWGQNWNNISLTYQGIGFRSFVDLKIKGGFWLSGGSEMNYRNHFRNIEALKNYSAWQKSALLGVSKKYNIGKKWKGNAQVLYDFMWKQQVPQGQKIIARFGYTF